MAWPYSLDMGIYVNWTDPDNNRSRVTWYVNVYGSNVYYSDYVTRGSITIQCRNNNVGSGAYFLHDNGTNLGTSWTPWSTWNGKTSMGGANYWNTIASGSLWLYHGTRGYVEMIASGNFESDSYYGTPYMEDGGWWQSNTNGGGMTDFDRRPWTPSVQSASRDRGSITMNLNDPGARYSGPARTSWQYRYSTNNAEPWTDGTNTSSQTQYFSGTPTQTYYFQFRAYNEDGWGDWGNNWGIHGSPSKPATPTATRSTTTANRIDVSWSAPASNLAIDQYAVDRYSANGQTFLYRMYSGGTATSAPDTLGISRGEQYTYRVYAHNSSGWSDISDYQLTPIMVPGVPNAPSSITSPIENSALKVGRNVTIQYAADSNLYGNTLVGYYMQFSTDNGATWHGWDNVTKTKITNGENAVTGGTFTYQLLTPALTYKWRVYAKNTIGTGDLTRVTPTGTFVSAGGRRWRGAGEANANSWQPTETAKRWNGSAWTSLTIAKRYDPAYTDPVTGSHWRDLT